MRPDDAARRIAEVIEGSREELAELALHLGNTFAPFGEETNVAVEVDKWYRNNGISSALIPVVDRRDNVVARLTGSGSGPSLLFNAHLDTEASGPDYDNLMQTPDLNRLGGHRTGDRLFGHTVLNDRGCMAAMMIAGRALRGAGVEIPGDIWLTSVVGETGAAPVDEFRGIYFTGKGLGTAFLAQHGVRADFGIVAEMTGFAPVWYHCGAAFFKVVFQGRRTYTPFLARPDTLRDHPNAVAKAVAAASALEAWAANYEQESETETAGGVVRPKAQVGAIRGGIPWRPNRSSTYCALYMDVRTLPSADVEEITRSIEDVVREIDPAAEVSCFMAKRGTVSLGVEPLIEAVRRAHAISRGREAPETADAPWLSMWRDTNVLNDAGIPSISLGPGPHRDDHGNRWMELDDLVAIAKIYALIAINMAR